MSVFEHSYEQVCAGVGRPAEKVFTDLRRFRKLNEKFSINSNINYYETTFLNTNRIGGAKVKFVSPKDLDIDNEIIENLFGN